MPYILYLIVQTVIAQDIRLNVFTQFIIGINTGVEVDSNGGCSLSTDSLEQNEQIKIVCTIIIAGIFRML